MPTRIDWYYHRNGCRTCQRTDGFLAKAGAVISEQIDARQERIGPAKALKIAHAADYLWIARGPSFRYFDMRKDLPSDAELRKLLIGPSGNLRAPTIRRGKKLFVGFNPEAYGEGLLT